MNDYHAINETPTHYWSIINPSNPPRVIWLFPSGMCAYGYAHEGELPKEYSKTNTPFPIVGYHPETHVYGFKFGNWRPVSEWLASRI